uniref:Uncharacterized protein n=1 Tax=Tetranychus urticae TaxID=32264 RepID=T1KYK8_TETUR
MKYILIVNSRKTLLKSKAWFIVEFCSG